MPQSTIPPPTRIPVQTQSHPADSAVTCIYQCDQHGTPMLSANSPWTIWGPGLIALGGVLITLTVKWIQDRRAAKHDLRRELFLKVTDAITNGSVLLGSVARSNISIDKLGDRFVKFIAPLNQAEVVADKPLLAALTVLKNQAGLAFGELIRTRLPMDRHLTDIATNKPLIEDASAEIKAILAEESRLVVDGIKTVDEQARFDRLQQRFSYFQGERQKHFEADKASRAAIQAVVAEVTKRAVEVQRNLIDARVQVLALLRKELGFKFDVDEYQHLQKQMANIAIDDLDRTVKTVNAVFATGDTKEDKSQ